MRGGATDTLTTGSAADRELGDLYAASRDCHHARIETERRVACIRYHEGQAERLGETVAALASSHRSNACVLRATRRGGDPRDDGS